MTRRAIVWYKDNSEAVAYEACTEVELLRPLAAEIEVECERN